MRFLFFFSRTRAIIDIVCLSGYFCLCPLLLSIEQLESLVAEMDVIAQRYSQPKFYPDPQFHASFAWALGGGALNPKVVDSMSELDGELGHDLRHCSVKVKKVSWKIGQKTGSVELLVG